MNDTHKTWPVMSIARAHTLLTAPGSRFEMEDVIIRGIKTRVWKNLPPTLREILLMARSYGEREFLVYEDERVSFEDFARASLAIAAELQSQCVVKGDRVAIIMRNIPEWAAVFMGAAVIGAIVTPLNAWWTGPELEYGLVDSGAKVAFVDAAHVRRDYEEFRGNGTPYTRNGSREKFRHSLVARTWRLYPPNSSSPPSPERLTVTCCRVISLTR